MNNFKIMIKRILLGEETQKTLGSCAVVIGEVPCDGFVIKANIPSGEFLYIRDSDLELAIKAREEKGKIVAIEAESWKEKRMKVDKQNKTTFETVACTKCGDAVEVPDGRLTEEQKRGYLCAACHEVLVELQAEKRSIGNRRLLID